MPWIGKDDMPWIGKDDMFYRGPTKWWVRRRRAGAPIPDGIPSTGLPPTNGKPVIVYDRPVVYAATPLLAEVTPPSFSGSPIVFYESPLLQSPSRASGPSSAGDVARFRAGALKRICWQEYQPGETIGEGSFGRVVSACKGPNDCKYVIKRSQIESSSELAAAIRDVFFLEKLATNRLDGQPIVPAFFGTWECVDPTTNQRSFNVAMDRWDGDMKRLGQRRRLGRGIPGPIYTRAELVRMFRLMYFLGSLKIAHGDAKPDQFLQRGDGKEIVIADFGFAGGKGSGGMYKGLMGWPSNDERYKCPRAFTPFDLYEEKTADFDIRHNIWQLESVLLYYGPTFVLSENGKISRFAGIRDFPRNQLTTCTKSADLYNILQRELAADPTYPLITLAMADIKT